MRRRYQSLFFKLFVVLLGAVGCTYVAFSGFYRSYWNTSSRPESQPSLIYYWGLFAKDLGTDTVKAERLSRELNVPIGVQGPGLNWRSEGLSKATSRDIAVATTHDSVAMVLREGRLWGGIRQGDYLYMFSSRRRSVSTLTNDWIALLPVLGLSCLLAWLLLRHLLRPLVKLENGVQAVADGDLDARISEDGSDEIAGLGRSFNVMARRLKEREQARDQLLLDVSHELRSPLTRMRVALEMAEPGLAVDSLHEEVDALGKMVSEILETERLKSQAGGLRRVPTDLNALMTEKLSRFEHRPPGIIRDGTIPQLVPMDVERMRLVLRNLLENALKYGGDSGIPVYVTLRSEKGTAVIEVRNGGPGVPEEEQRLIFEPFYRTDRSRSGAPGYGLGLPLCKRIVEAHGGGIEFRSRPGETTVTVRLPLA
jgi:signal transduction histidine kinase